MVCTVSIYYDKSLLENDTAVPRYDAKVFRPPTDLDKYANPELLRKINRPLIHIFMWKGDPEPPPKLDELSTWVEFRDRFITHGELQLSRDGDEAAIKQDVDEYISACFDVEIEEAGLYYAVVDDLSKARQAVLITDLEYHPSQIEYVLRCISLRPDYARYERTRVTIETSDGAKISLYAGKVTAEGGPAEGGQVIEFDFAKASATKPVEPTPRRTPKKSEVKNPRKRSTAKESKPANPRKKK